MTDVLTLLPHHYWGRQRLAKGVISGIHLRAENAGVLTKGDFVLIFCKRGLVLGAYTNVKIEQKQKSFSPNRVCAFYFRSCEMSNPKGLF